MNKEYGADLENMNSILIKELEFLKKENAMLRNCLDLARDIKIYELEDSFIWDEIDNMLGDI